MVVPNHHIASFSHFFRIIFKTRGKTSFRTCISTLIPLNLPLFLFAYDIDIDNVLGMLTWRGKKIIDEEKIEEKTCGTREIFFRAWTVSGIYLLLDELCDCVRRTTDGNGFHIEEIRRSSKDAYGDMLDLWMIQNTRLKYVKSDALLQ